MHIILMLMLLVSCGKDAAPALFNLVPEIVSTEVIPETNSVHLFASVSNSANFTGCGFGIIENGLIREYNADLDSQTMSFSMLAEGLTADCEYSFYAFLSNGVSRIQTPARIFHTLQQKEPEKPVPSVSFTSFEVVPGISSALINAALSEIEDVTEVGVSISQDGQNYARYSATLETTGFSITIDNLSSDTEYHCLAWAIQRGKEITSEINTFRTQKEIITANFTSLEAEATAFSVLLEARVSDGSHLEACGFGLSRDGRKPVEYGSALNGDRFYVQIDDLLPDTDYTWYAFFIIEGNRTTSEFLHFRTKKDPTLYIQDIQASAGIYDVALEARLSHTSGVLSCGFALATDGGDFIRHSCTPKDNGYFSTSFDGLSPERNYRFYAWAQTEDGELISETFSFTTKQAPNEDIHFIGLSAGPSNTSALVSAVLSSTDGISECGFGLSKNTYDFIEYSGTLTDKGFYSNLSSLTVNTTYYYYAFFVLDGKRYQSDISTFTTLQ